MLKRRMSKFMSALTDDVLAEQIWSCQRKLAHAMAEAQAHGLSVEPQDVLRPIRISRPMVPKPKPEKNG